MSENFTNFYAFPSGSFKRRPGLMEVPWVRRGLWRRLKAWWSGNPTCVNSIIVFADQLFVATDRGLYILDRDRLKPVPIHVPTQGDA